MIRVLTAKHERYIRKNYLKESTVEIGRKLGLPKGTVGSFLRREKLRIPKRLAKQRRLAARNKNLAREAKKYHKGDSTIKAHYLTMPSKTLAAKIGRSDTYLRQRMKELGLVIPADIILQRKKDSRIKPGNVPINKGRKQADYMSAEQIEKTKATRFQKGQQNHNELYDGAITIRNDHPDRNGGRTIKQIRLGKGKWQELQKYNWEKKNGPIPKGMVLACKNGDTLNCKPSNWELITRSENLQRNNKDRDYLNDKYIAMQLSKKGRKPDKELQAEILKHPELIKTKRLQLQLNRQINVTENRKKAPRAPKQAGTVRKQGAGN